jgi:hypothetical protein
MSVLEDQKAEDIIKFVADGLDTSVTNLAAFLS